MGIISLPIYYTQHLKTKKDRTFLVGMNWYRNAHHFISNDVKKHYATLVASQLEDIAPTEGTYRLHLKLYYANPTCDGSNIFSIMEKFVLDTLQAHKVVKQDNVKFHKGTMTTVMGLDKLNPRVEIELIKEDVKNGTD